MKPVQPEQFMAMFKKRNMSIKGLERIRAIGMMLEEDGDKFGVHLQTFADDQLTLRQAAWGGDKYEKGSRHWDMSE